MNCRTCNTPHPPCELVDKSDTDKKGICLQCLLKQRDALYAKCQAYKQSYEYEVVIPEDDHKAILAAVAKTEKTESIK